MDWRDSKFWLVVLALVAFNVPILFACWHFRNVANLSQMLREKSGDGREAGAISYSRVTGLIGAVVVASLFWIMSNVSIAVAIINPGDLANILSGVTKLFFVGAALFVPYAFNQIKTLIQ